MNINHLPIIYFFVTLVVLKWIKNGLWTGDSFSDCARLVQIFFKGAVRLIILNELRYFFFVFYAKMLTIKANYIHLSDG